MRIFIFRHCARFLQEVDYLFAGDSWKIIQKSINGLTCHQVIDQIFHRDARTVKDG